MQYDLAKDEAAVIDQMRMTPAQLAAMRKAQTDHEEEVLRTRLKPEQYAKIVAERDRRAAFTDEERKADMIAHLESVIEAFRSEPTPKPILKAPAPQKQRR